MEGFTTRILKCSAKYFGSYRDVSFDFSNLGLALISGDNGAGKSTLFDIPCWIITGTTPKDHGVDGVKSWFETDNPTEGVLSVQTPSGTVTITRIRGKALQNDLYWTEEQAPEVQVRGKNLIDTQRKLESRLGIDSELYITGSYVHEFSKADTFFISNSKDRREVLEKLVDQSQAIALGDKASEERKVIKKEIEKHKSKFDFDSGKLKSTEELALGLVEASKEWEKVREKDIQVLQEKSDKFEIEKEKEILDCQTKILDTNSKLLSEDVLDDMESKLNEEQDELKRCVNKEQEISVELSILLQDISKLEKDITHLSDLHSFQTCPTCSGPVDSNITNKRQKALIEEKDVIQTVMETLRSEALKLKDVTSKEKELHSKVKKLADTRLSNTKLQAYLEGMEKALLQLKGLKNTYLDEIEAAKTEENPHQKQIHKITLDIALLKNEVLASTHVLKELEDNLSSLNLLYDISFEFRGALLGKAIAELEKSTNRYLETYFDAEVKAAFSLQSADKLEVDIYRNGYKCQFQQLSRGQRAMLKFAFRISVLKAAANKSGIKFSCLMLDEVFDGLTDGFKKRAFGVLEELSNEHDSVLVIDHAESLKSLFDKQFLVTLSGDCSEISLNE